MLVLFANKHLISAKRYSFYWTLNDTLTLMDTFLINFCFSILYINSKAENNITFLNIIIHILRNPSYF